MKKVLLIIAITIFGAGAVGASPKPFMVVYDQKKEDRKKDPPGPPVVKEKKDERPKDAPPKRGKKPD